MKNLNDDKKAAVLFSGGIDCSLATLLLRKEGYIIHLLHYEHGANISNGLHRIRYNELLSVVGNEKLYLKELSHRGLFRKLALENIESDFEKYKTNLICLGCRMAMHVETIVYCLQNNINVVTDGSVKYQSDFPEQNKNALNMFNDLYKHFDIEYRTILSDVSNVSEVKYKLLDNGISIQSMEDTCLFNNTFHKAADEAISNFIEERKQICIDYINERMLLVS